MHATVTHKRPTGVMAFRIQKYLGGLRYLADRVYESPIVLSCEVRRQPGG